MLCDSQQEEGCGGFWHTGKWEREWRTRKHWIVRALEERRREMTWFPVWRWVFTQHYSLLILHLSWFMFQSIFCFYICDTSCLQPNSHHPSAPPIWISPVPMTTTPQVPSSLKACHRPPTPLGCRGFRQIRTLSTKPSSGVTDPPSIGYGIFMMGTSGVVYVFIERRRLSEQIYDPGSYFSPETTYHDLKID